MQKLASPSAFFLKPVCVSSRVGVQGLLHGSRMKQKTHSRCNPVAPDLDREFVRFCVSLVGGTFLRLGSSKENEIAQSSRRRKVACSRNGVRQAILGLKADNAWLPRVFQSGWGVQPWRLKRPCREQFSYKHGETLFGDYQSIRIRFCPEHDQV